MTKLNIVYASEMGTAMDVADKTEAIAKGKGVDVVQFGMDSVSMDELKTMSKLMIITSTTGDGDLPMMGERPQQKKRKQLLGPKLVKRLVQLKLLS